MSVGAQQDKQAIDNRAFGLSMAMRDLLVQIDNFNSFLAGKTDADLTAPAVGYLQADVDLLKSAITQLKAGADVLRGQGTQATANNFLFFSNQLVGPN